MVLLNSGSLSGAGLLRRDDPEDPGHPRHKQEGDQARLLGCRGTRGPSRQLILSAIIIQGVQYTSPEPGYKFQMGFKSILRTSRGIDRGLERG